MFNYHSADTVSTDYMSIYFDIVKDLAKDKHLGMSDVDRLIAPSNELDVIPTLLNLPIDGEVLYRYISKKLGVKFFDISTIDSVKDIQVFSNGLLSGEVLYSTNPIKSLRKFNEYKSLFSEEKLSFSEIGIVPEEIIRQVVSVQQKETNPLSSGELTSLFDNILNSALEVGASEIYLKDVGLERIVYRRVNNVLMKTATSLKEIDFLSLNDVILSYFNINKESVSESDLFKSGFSSDYNHRGHHYRLRVSFDLVSDSPVISYIKIDRVGANHSLASLGYEREVLNPYLSLLSSKSGIVTISGLKHSGLKTFINSTLDYLVSRYPQKNIAFFNKGVASKVAGVNYIDSTIDLAGGVDLNYDIIVIEDLSSEKEVQAAQKLASLGVLVIIGMISTTALASIQKLISLGASTSILSQLYVGGKHVALIPRVCSSCSKEIKFVTVEGSSDYYMNLESSPTPNDSVLVCGASGCSSCVDGTTGVIPVSEVVVPNKQIRALIHTGYTAKSAYEVLKSEGWKPIYEYGINHVRLKNTTLQYFVDHIGDIIKTN